MHRNEEGLFAIKHAALYAVFPSMLFHNVEVHMGGHPEQKGAGNVIFQNLETPDTADFRENTD